MYITEKEIRNIAQEYAKAVLPDEEIPYDVRSVIPNGVSTTTDYMAARICAAVWFQQGFTYAMENPNKTPDEFKEHIAKETEDADPHIKEHMQDAFAAGVSLFILKEVHIHYKDRVTTIKLEKVGN